MKYIQCIALACVMQVFVSCAPDQYCYRNEDCDSPMICKADGSCGYACRQDWQCGTGFVCRNFQCAIAEDPCADGACGLECENDDGCPGEQTCVSGKCCEGENCAPECENDDGCPGEQVCTNGRCEDGTVPGCPDGMSLIRNTYCMDQYEASRPDATGSSAGQDSSRAVSKASVMPWNIGDDNAAAEAACQAAGKRLCSPTEWEFGCHGVNDTVYGYGDVYDPAICNGLDTYGRSGFHLMPTGSFPDCTNGWGVYDLSGNLWEHTAGGSGKTVRGGAFNCVDSEGNHKCSYIPQRWTPLSIGFRCCSEPIRVKKKRSDAGTHANSILSWKGDILLAWNEPAESAADTGSDAVVPMADLLTQPECEPPERAIRKAEVLWQDDETAREAINILKAARVCAPNDPELSLALGIAYARVQNFPWALKTLARAQTSLPGDCRVAAWRAWTYLQMGQTEEVEKITRSIRCEGNSASVPLVRAYGALSRNDTELARRLLQNVQDTRELGVSDADALRSLRDMAGIPHSPNMTWKAELDAGYASNALSGSPNDPRLTGKELGSAFVEADLRLMVDPWKNAFARAIFEGQVSGQLLMADDAYDTSYLDVAFRPGIAVDWENLKFGAYYRPEMLFVMGGDNYASGPLFSYMSHRIELDAEIHRWLYIFGGYGHRIFRQKVRTREELDIGAGGFHALGAGFALTWGATYRHWFSTGKMYDLNGTNVSLALDYRISDVQFRLQGAYAFDDYADSKGYFDSSRARRDNLLKGTFQVWSPAWNGLRIGALFKAGRRWSSADDYDYTDVRGQLAIRWTGELDFYAPRRVPDGIYALPWSLQGADAAERIRDIIQQDEDLQRTSSCLQN